MAADLQSAPVPGLLASQALGPLRPSRAARVVRRRYSNVVLLAGESREVLAARIEAWLEQGLQP